MHSQNNFCLLLYFLVILNLIQISVCFGRIGRKNQTHSFKSNADKIIELKDYVFKHYGNNVESDLESVRNSNWFFERYLQGHNYDVKKAEKAIIEGLDFFHKEGFHQISDTYFPSEAFATGGMYRFGISKFDQPVLGIVMSHLRPLGPRLSKPAFNKLTEKFSLYNIYKILFDGREKNFITYIVFTNASMDNTDYALLQKTFHSLDRYFDGAPAKVYIVGMNKIIKMAVKLLIGVLRSTLRERISFVNNIEQVEDFVSIDEIPVHAGGHNKFFKRIPSGVKSGKCLPYLNITPKDWDIYREINNGIIQEGMTQTKADSLDQYLNSCD